MSIYIDACFDFYIFWFRHFSLVSMALCTAVKSWNIMPTITGINVSNCSRNQSHIFQRIVLFNKNGFLKMKKRAIFSFLNWCILTLYIGGNLTIGSTFSLFPPYLRNTTHCSYSMFLLQLSWVQEFGNHHQRKPHSQTVLLQVSEQLWNLRLVQTCAWLTSIPFHQCVACQPDTFCCASCQVLRCWLC